VHLPKTQGGIICWESTCVRLEMAMMCACVLIVNNWVSSYQQYRRVSFSLHITQLHKQLGSMDRWVTYRCSSSARSYTVFDPTASPPASSHTNMPFAAGISEVHFRLCRLSVRRLASLPVICTADRKSKLEHSFLSHYELAHHMGIMPCKPRYDGLMDTAIMYQFSQSVSNACIFCPSTWLKHRVEFGINRCHISKVE
jgi:hypothetical protein